MGMAGSGFGVALGIWGYLAAGAGHGTYVLIAISSAPLGLLGIPVAAFGAPVLCGGVGFLLAAADRSPQRKLFLALAAAHYLGSLLLLTTRSFGDWDYFNKVIAYMPGLIAGWLVTYSAGHVLMWLAFRKVNIGSQTG